MSEHSERWAETFQLSYDTAKASAEGMGRALIVLGPVIVVALAGLIVVGVLFRLPDVLIRRVV